MGDKLTLCSEARLRELLAVEAKHADLVRLVREYVKAREEIQTYPHRGQILAAVKIADETLDLLAAAVRGDTEGKDG